MKVAVLEVLVTICHSSAITETKITRCNFVSTSLLFSFLAKRIFFYIQNLN